MKTDELSPTPSRLPQVVVVAVAAVAAVLIARGDKFSEAAEPSPAPNPSAKPTPYDMLACLDERVGVQENRKDVRCLSSQNKFLMFTTNCEFSEEAKTERIEQHMRLIQLLYDKTIQRAPGQKRLPAGAVTAELNERFPRVDSEQGARFNLGGVSTLLVEAEALKDYSDTIEPWRLLQTWATLHVDAKGKLQLDVQFGEEALTELYKFFRAFDLAMLRRARDNAFKRKLTIIDAEAIRAGFGAWPVQKP